MLLSPSVVDYPLQGTSKQQLAYRYLFRSSKLFFASAEYRAGACRPVCIPPLLSFQYLVVEIYARRVKVVASENETEKSGS